MCIVYKVDGFIYEDVDDILEYLDDQLSTSSYAIQFGYYAIIEGIEDILKLRVPIDITLCGTRIEVVNC